MAEAYQWAVPCNECDSSVAYNCNTCSIALCPVCKEKHLNSENSKHHTIVLYSERVKPATRDCKRHPNNVLFAWCNTCSYAVCIECVTASCHKQHDFVKFEEKISQKRAILQSEFQKTVGLCSVWQDSISDLEKRKETLEKSFEGIDSDIKKHADKFHHELKQIQEERSQQLQMHKLACLQNVSSDIRILKNNLDKFEKERCKYENILRSDDIVAILEFNQTQTEHNTNEPYDFNMPRLPLFIAGELDTNQMERMFGRLAFKEAIHQGYSKSAKVKEKKLPNANISLRPRSNSLPSIHVESGCIKTGWNAPCPIVCIGHGQAWIATQKRVLKLVDKDNNSTGEKVLDFIICDAALTSSGDIMLLDSNKNCVRQLSGKGRVITLFTLDLKPYSICPLNTEDVIITFRDNKKVIKYSRHGVQLMEFDNLGLDRPWNLAQNKFNQHIYITDKIGYGYYKDPGRVVICTENGEFLREYTGPDDSVFTPVDVCSDKMGQMFITDYGNHRVHIVNVDGVFLRFLEMNGRAVLTNPCRIDINDSMYVWLSEHVTGKVKVLRCT